MFVPRSVTRRVDYHLSHKSNPISTENSNLRKIEIIDERKSVTNPSPIPVKSDDSGAFTDPFAFYLKETLPKILAKMIWTKEKVKKKKK